jgi:hypothetical protein
MAHPLYIHYITLYRSIYLKLSVPLFLIFKNSFNPEIIKLYPRLNFGLQVYDIPFGGHDLDT